MQVYIIRFFADYDKFDLRFSFWAGLGKAQLLFQEVNHIHTNYKQKINLKQQRGFKIHLRPSQTLLQEHSCLHWQFHSLCLAMEVVAKHRLCTGLIDLIDPINK